MIVNGHQTAKLDLPLVGLGQGFLSLAAGGAVLEATCPQRGQQQWLRLGKQDAWVSGSISRSSKIFQRQCFQLKNNLIWVGFFLVLHLRIC